MTFPAVQSLSQDELDDAYHLASFHADEALRAALGELWKANPEVLKHNREVIAETLCAALCLREQEHLGAARYDALMVRLMERRRDRKPD